MRTDWMEWIDEMDIWSEDRSSLSSFDAASYATFTGYSQPVSELSARLQRRELMDRLSQSPDSTDQAIYRMIN